jgi:hypothetical protein
LDQLCTIDRKVFFFEKKKQKTFGFGMAPPLSLRLGDKSFLVLFFKKELLSACPALQL